MIIYENFKALKLANDLLATELLENVTDGEWMNEEIYYYNNLEDFAYYELTQGWYINWFSDLDRQNFNGAPNPLDYIDLKELGNNLSNAWDESCNFISTQNQILQMSFGW